MPLSITRTNITIQDFRRISGKSSRRKPVLVLGPASSASSLAANVAKRVTTAQEVVDYAQHGPMVEAACDSLVHENRVAIIMRTDASEPGEVIACECSFADPNGPDVAGDPVLLPEDDLEPGIEFVSGGILGQASPPITYRYRTGGSLSATLSGTLSLGTATSITLPFGGGTYNLTPQLVKLLARAVDLTAQFVAHTNEFGTYHTAADPNAPYAITAAADEATLYQCCDDLKVAGLVHVVEPTSHAVPDAASQAAITALVVPTTLFEAVTFLEGFYAAFFGITGHTMTAPGVHLVADAVNVPTTTAVTAGTITAGDTIEPVTKAPRWTIAELGLALDAILELPNSLDYDGILLCGPVLTKSEADAIATKVEALRKKARWRRLAPHFRLRNPGEAITAYRDAFEAAFGLVQQRALHGPGVSWYPQSSHPGRFGQVDVRPYSFAYFSRLCTLRPDINPTDETDPPNGFGSFTRGYVRDPNNPQAILPRAVDENLLELFTPLRGVAPRTKNQVNEGIVFPGQGAMLAPEGSDYYIAPYARIIDEACNVAFRPLEVRLGRKVLEAPDHTIEPNERKRIEAGITEDLSGPIVKTGIAQAVSVSLDPDALLNTPPPVVVGATITVDVGGYIDEWNVDISLS